MKRLILLTLFSLSAFASEYPTDPCPSYERQEKELTRELRLFQTEAYELAERGQYPQDFDERGCEDVMDDATFVDRRIKAVQKQLRELRAAQRRYCYSGDDIP